MEKSFIKSIDNKIKSLNKSLTEITNFWMCGKFEPETNARIGRSIDFINKAIAELEKLKN